MVMLQRCAYSSSWLYAGARRGCDSQRHSLVTRVYRTGSITGVVVVVVVLGSGRPEPATLTLSVLYLSTACSEVPWSEHCDRREGVKLLVYAAAAFCPPHPSPNTQPQHVVRGWQREKSAGNLK